MNVDRYINSMTPDVRMRKILKQAATVDDSPASRCVMKAFLNSELSALVKERAPRLGPAIQAFVGVPEPKCIYRGLQALVWLCEEIPPNQDRGMLILLGCQMYIEQEAKADVARQAIDFMGRIG